MNNLMTVKEVSSLSGVSVRTLHYYDEINLLKPTKINNNGYRLYDNEALAKLQKILLLEELAFSLKDIKSILESSVDNYQKLLADQLTLLKLKQNHLTKIIQYTQNLVDKGDINMDFSIFNQKEYEEYAKEAKERWQETKTYQDYDKRKTSPQDQMLLANQMMEIFRELGSLKDLPLDNEQIRIKIKELQQFITDHYYKCTDEMMKSLGEMYISDERMKKNIDEAGGNNTAAFVAQAIKKIYQ